MRPDAVKHAFVGVGIAPAQVGVQHVTREVVRIQAVAARVHERQTAQPGEQVVRVIDLSGVPQQRLRRRPGECTHSRVHVGADRWARGPRTVSQSLHQVGRQRIHRDLTAAGGHVSEEGQAQRVTMRDLENRVRAPSRPRPTCGGIRRSPQESGCPGKPPASTRPIQDRHAMRGPAQSVRQ